MLALLYSLSRLATSTVFWVSSFFLTVSYLLLASRYTTVKQRSWLLTAISSALMSIFSLPLVVQYAAASGQLKHVVVPPVVTDGIGTFFQAYLIVDLTMGMLFYASKVNLLTGWIHHTVYIFIVEYAIQGRWSHIFALCAVMEIPTFLLAAGSIIPRLRSDVLFAVSFFTTRIALHVALCASLFVQRNAVTNGSLGPAIIMACIFPLHAHWFSGSIKGFLKRAKVAEQSVAVTKPPANASSLSERPVTPSISGPVSLYASRASLARRRTALRMVMRARWDQLGLWQASGRLREVQRRVRAALPGRERVYQYVGLERLRHNVAPTGQESQDQGVAAMS